MTMVIIGKQLAANDATLHFAQEYAGNARQAIRQTFFRMGRDIKKKTSDDILDKSTKTGIWYRVRSRSGKSRRWHQASAPYETHANLSGALRKSLGWKVYGSEMMEFGYGVTKPTTDYARRIELGGTDNRGITIKPRPSLENNTKNVRFETFFDEAIRAIDRK